MRPRFLALFRSSRLARPAAVLAATFVLGLAGGSVVGASLPVTPPYRLVALTYLDWITPAEAAPPASILQISGELRALTIEGRYRSDRLDRSIVNAIFADVADADEWAAAYPGADSGTGRVLRVTLVGATSRTIDITNPDDNQTVPRSLLTVVTAVQRLSIGIAREGTPADDFVLRARATRLDAPPPGVSVASLPDGVALADLAAPGGVAIPRGGPLASAWHPYEILILGNIRYTTNADGQVWRVSWTLDLDDLEGRSR